jgi:hypothetical protein
VSDPSLSLSCAVRQVLVKTLSGRTIVIDVGPHDTIADLKRAIADKEGVPIRLQRVIATNELHDAIELFGCGLCHGSTVQLLLGLSGGAEAAPAGTRSVCRPDVRSCARSSPSRYICRVHRWLLEQ